MKTVLILMAVLSAVPARADVYRPDMVGTARTFSEQKNKSERRPLPKEASPMPDKDLLATDPVTFEELRRFARDWRKYARWLKEGNNQYKAVAYLGVSRRLDYPVAVVRWADEHGWAADRFFLLERKFRLTLSVLRQQERRANLTGHLQRRIEETRANSSLSPEQKKQQLSQFYRSIREIQKATQAKAPVTPDEYELIKLNKTALETILKD